MIYTSIDHTSYGGR